MGEPCKVCPSCPSRAAILAVPPGAGLSDTPVTPPPDTQQIHWQIVKKLLTDRLTATESEPGPGLDTDTAVSSVELTTRPLLLLWGLALIAFLATGKWDRKIINDPLSARAAAAENGAVTPPSPPPARPPDSRNTEDKTQKSYWVCFRFSQPNLPKKKYIMTCCATKNTKYR